MDFANCRKSAEDEASLYLQATVSRVWAPKGQTPVVRAHPGRGDAGKAALAYRQYAERTGDPAEKAEVEALLRQLSR